MIISVDTALRQAKVSFEDELLFLWSHGLCHLLGYDHQDDTQELQMNARMTELLVIALERGAVRAA